MIQRKTQTPAYWDEEFIITSSDLQYLSTLLVDDELPRSAPELGWALVRLRCREEDLLIERALAQGTPYQPKRSYQKAERVVFPAQGYQVGTVTDVRPGHNPEHGTFQVILVEFENGEKREFASEFEGPHALNLDANAGPSAASGLSSPDELAKLYASSVGEKLETSFEADAGFVRLAGRWFPRDLLVDVHEGHLNLAEAVLDTAGGGPLLTEELLGDLDLAVELSPQLRAFSLNYALQEDDRFDEVGPAGEILWYLRSLEPEGVKVAPICLQYKPIKYDGNLPTSEMLELERDLGDEWSALVDATDVVDSATIVLTYPHWNSGTLPLSKRLSGVFPTGRTRRIRFTLVDGETGEEMPAWVVRLGRYVYGLKEWYEKHSIPVGAYLDIQRGEHPGRVVIQRQSRRPRREWVRVALPVDGRLTFEMRKTLISCKYSELMIVTEEKPGAVEAVWTRTREKALSIKRTLDEIFPELAKLSPQGTVHASTLYSALNIAIRTPPGPLFADLVSSETYVPVGDNYWVLHMGPSGGT